MTGAGDIPRAVLLDTAVASTNLGDQIIMEAVRKELDRPLAGALVTAVASHEVMGAKGRGLIRSARLAVAGGTNLISSHIWLRSTWRLRPADAFLGAKVVLMGVGWYQFQAKPDPYTAWLLRRVLHPTALHSVRDGYSADMLRSIGIGNVINTGCPTLWGFTPQACAALPKTRAESVVTTLNTYIPDRALDGRLIETLRGRYKTIYAWVQTAEDHAYLKSFGDDIVILEPSLAAYDTLLRDEPDLDYVGNRLHGGIRALQHGRRAIIVEIDNRAREMGRDFNLPTVERDDFARLTAMIDGTLNVDVRPPTEAIKAWKQQFAGLLQAGA